MAPALSGAMLAAATLLWALPSARAAVCADRLAKRADCARRAYERTRVADLGECCALCASEANCTQWTFHALSRQCARTSLHEQTILGPSESFATCGAKQGPAPAPAPTPSPPLPGKPKEWAVIVAGSSGYMNYRHQADACHAYQIAKAQGIPEERIILMAYDDIANNSANPFKGKVFNHPDPQGPGKDVYAGCKIDYRGQQVTPENFLGVLSGKGQGRVLRSTREDHVFVFFTDHGATGLIAFPSSELHKAQLQSTLTQMHQDKMFSRLVFYLEACESGSMFQGMNIPGVYALSASSATESSWGTYCDRATNTVNGTSLGTCLGDLFSVSWMEDSDTHDATKETLQAQFVAVRALTNLSHVQQWGDLSFTNDTLAGYLGARAGARPRAAPAAADALRSAVSTRQTSEERLAAAALLQRELAQQQQAEWVYRRLTQLIYPESEAKQAALRSRASPPDHPECELRAHAAVRVRCAARFDANSGFALRFHQIVVNACADVAGGLDADVAALAARACAERTEPAAAGPATGSAAEELVV